MPKPVQPGFVPFDFRSGFQIPRWRGLNYSPDIASLPPDQLADGQNIRPHGGGYVERGGQTELIDFGDNGFVHETVTGMIDARNILGAPPGHEHVNPIPGLISDTVYLYPIRDTDSLLNTMATSVTGVSKASCVDDYHGAVSDGDYMVSHSLYSRSYQGIYLTNLPYTDWTITSLTVGVKAWAEAVVGTEQSQRPYQVYFRVTDTVADSSTEVPGGVITLDGGAVYELMELAPMLLNPDTNLAWTQADIKLPEIIVEEDPLGPVSFPVQGKVKIRYYQLYLKVIGTHR